MTGPDNEWAAKRFFGINKDRTLAGGT
jgi:hypothetical protein